MSVPSPLVVVLDYHARTKHHPGRYARSLGRLDWANQPDPFRTFDGAPRRALDLAAAAPQPTYDGLFGAEIPSHPLDRAFVSRLLQDSLALSAWKQAPGTRPWSLRINPSSGALHPTEGYLLLPPIPGLNDHPGIHHYQPYHHALEERFSLTKEEWRALTAGLPQPCLLVGLTSIWWREAWKYGERAFRYCQHDVGHALGALAFSARLLGWDTRLLDLPDRDLAVLLGCDRQQGTEAEHPDALLVLHPRQPSSTSSGTPSGAWTEVLDRLRTTLPAGTSNRLSAGHHDWPILNSVGAATEHRSLVVLPPASSVKSGPAMTRDRDLSAQDIIRRRRSAVDMDGRTPLPAGVFFDLLRRTLPTGDRFPFSLLPWEPQVSLLLFVHRVPPLPSGLYLLARGEGHAAALRRAMQPAFAWAKPLDCPADLPLFLLADEDVRAAAKWCSCGQDIAPDGAFAVAMLARFRPALEEFGPSFYSRLHWECGLIGQVLYLEAEAAGVRGTGIGCFFDDVLHESAGLENDAWQTLYHFTIGGPVEDPRLQTFAPYRHLHQVRDSGSLPPADEG